MTIPMSRWSLVTHILKEDYFRSGQYRCFIGTILTFDWDDDKTAIMPSELAREPFSTGQYGGIEDIFRSFEDRSWDSIKSIFLSILNLALEQKFDGIVMELDGQVVNVN